jgi:hypothetical protein
MLKFLSSRLEPDAVAAKLREIVDEEVVDPKSPTLYAGERPLVGWVNPDRFKIHRRPPVYWALWWLTPGQWFKPVVEGTVTSKDNGTEIEIVGGTPIWIKICWALALLGAAGLISLLIVLSYPYNITHDPMHAGAKMLLGIIFLNVVAGIFVVLPLIGWFTTRNDLPAIVNELKGRLEPQIKESAIDFTDRGGESQISQIATDD